MPEESYDPPGSRPAVNLTLNLDAILAPTQNAAVLSTELVDFMFDAMGKADLSKKPANDATQYKFKTPEISAAERRAMFENWLFLKGFQDLMRGVRASLEQAYLFLELLTRPQKTKSDTTLMDFLAPFRRKAAKLNFPDLLDQVNGKLPKSLNFVDAYHSLQRARNCLEHRNGIVSDVDAPARGVMLLSFPRVKNFYIRKGQEIELEVGHIVDAEDDSEQVQIFTRIELRERRFSKGDRLSISITDFNEIAFACNYFVSELAAKVGAAGKADKQT
jgi:predicted KAP-like P-loop ATPase